MTTRFIYFDLGRVLLDYDPWISCLQMAEVAGCSPEDIRRIVFDSPLHDTYEFGRMTTQEFFDAFCRESNLCPELDAFMCAGNDIFTIKHEGVSVAVQLRLAGWPMGILSNVCDAHWAFITAKFEVLSFLFDRFVLSYQVGHGKPEPEIFAAAIETAGCRPEEILFIDDLPQNVEGAKAAGIDAVLYRGTRDLLADLRARNIGLNY